jgi:hypothetical protein
MSLRTHMVTQKIISKNRCGSPRISVISNLSMFMYSIYITERDMIHQNFTILVSRVLYVEIVVLK